MQRSASDPSLLVATYEGEHNHRPITAETSMALSPGLVPFECSGAAECLDLREPTACTKTQSEFQKSFVEEMVSSLTRNPSFTDALAAAITSRILDEAVLDNSEESISDSKLSSV